MDFSYLANEIKKIYNSVEGCTTKTTEKKGDGFTPRNRHGIKCGQVDVHINKIRIVLDLYPGRYGLEDLKSIFQIPERDKGGKYTGLNIKRTEKSPPSHDMLEITLYLDYFNSVEQNEISNSLKFIKRSAIESTFKTESSL